MKLKKYINHDSWPCSVKFETSYDILLFKCFQRTKSIIAISFTHSKVKRYKPKYVHPK